MYQNLSKLIIHMNTKLGPPCWEVAIFTHLFPMRPSSAPLKMRKYYGFLMFSGVRERMHWEQMGCYVIKSLESKYMENQF